MGNKYNNNLLKLTINKNTFWYAIVTILITLCGVYLLSVIDYKNSYEQVTNDILIVFFLLLIQLCLFSRFIQKIFSNYGIFLLSFICFNYGLFFVFAFGGNYNFSYLMQYEIPVVLDTILYQFIGTEMMFLAGGYAKKSKPFKYNIINRFSIDYIFSIGSKFTIITGIVAFALLFIKSIIFLNGYYNAVRIFETKVPSIIGLIEYFFIPFAVLTLIYSKNRRIDNLLKITIFIWSLITALCGDRTSGIAGILILLVIITKFKDNKDSNVLKYIKLIFGIALVLFLIVFIKTFREGDIFSANSILSMLTDVLGELGSSFLPLTLIMRICPQVHSYLYGESYLFSIISGFIPASLDPTGMIAYWNRISIQPLYWISSDYDYTFGTGYSLCAEAYANFGWGGFIALFFIGLSIVKLLAYQKDNKFSLYTSSILLFEFFTLPRRNIYYIINHYTYCVLFVLLILFLLKNSKGRGNFVE